MRYILLTVLLLAAMLLKAQNQEAIWMFGNASTVDFTGTLPVAGSMPNSGGNPPAWGFDQSGAVCDASKNLLFWVKLRYSNNPGASNYPNVFRADGTPMANSNLMSEVQGGGVPVIVPWPGQPSKYFVFYIKSGGLRYSVVDMTLDAGNGAVDASAKNVLVGKNAQLIEQKMTAVLGCNGVWLVVRSRNEGKFYSYRIGESGVDATGVESLIGNLPFNQYGGLNSYSGVIKSSPDGRRLVSANCIGVPGSSQPPKGGLEIYDVEQCSGKITNAVLLDTGAYYGACFSPDGTKLYATRIFDRTVYQFDLSLPTNAAIIASKTFILANPFFSWYPEEYILGDLKRGLDGRIYLSNNVCTNSPYTNGMHVITQPNVAGTGCNPLLNTIITGGAGACTGLNLPADIIYYVKQDTLSGTRYELTACFIDSIIATASDGGCHKWSDGISGRERVFKTPGEYTCFYQNGNCQMIVDTYTVKFTQVPEVAAAEYSCINRGMAYIAFGGATGEALSYSLKDNAGVTLAQGQSRDRDTLGGLLPGIYRLQLITKEGCDTTFTITVKALPKPEADFEIAETACEGNRIDIENRSVAPWVKWYYFYDSSAAKTPDIVFYHTGFQDVTQVVRNVEGCYDTLVKSIFIRDFHVTLAADPPVVHKNEWVTLTSDAGEAFKVRFWKPLLSDSSAKTLRLQLDTTKVFTVFTESEFGCRDSASITVNVEPYVFFPSAFTPNGDGKNDRFRPVSAGAPIFVTFFYIYNRWGQLVYGGQGPAARDGWDGTFKGIPCDVGTYYYMIQVETPQGEIIKQNGDVTLLK